jgi:hypothetical protein
MQNIFAGQTLRVEILFAALAIAMSLPHGAQAQDASVEVPMDPPSSTPSSDVGSEALDSTIEMEASIDLTGSLVGPRFAVGRVFGDHVVLMGAAGFRASLDGRPNAPDHYSVDGRLSLKVYARAPRVHAVSPTIMTSFIFGTNFIDRVEGLRASRTHDVGGQLHVGATYFATPALGIQVRTGIGVARAIGEDVFRHRWYLASTTELGITIRY